MDYIHLAYRMLASITEFDPGVAHWKQVINWKWWPIQMLDRRELVKFPFRMHLLPEFKMPEDLTNPLTYEQCCEKRAAELIELGRQRNVPIAMLWSGGLDSTCALVSLFKQGANANNLRIYFNGKSIEEHPQFYKKYIQNKYRYNLSDNFDKAVNDDVIFVTGELNDQLMGYDFTLLDKLGVDSWSVIHEPYVPEKIMEWITILGIQDQVAVKKWFDLMDYSAKNAPCEVKSNLQLFWWFNFCFKWQYVNVRFLGPQKNQANMKSLVEAGHYQNFFNTTDFQKWSMTVDPKKKVVDSRNNYKKVCRDLIYAFDKDEAFYQTKTKVPSPLIDTKKPAAGLDSNYKFYDDDEIDVYSLYQNDHFFL